VTEVLKPGAFTAKIYASRTIIMKEKNNFLAVGAQDIIRNEDLPRTLPV